MSNFWTSISSSLFNLSTFKSQLINLYKLITNDRHLPKVFFSNISSITRTEIIICNSQHTNSSTHFLLPGDTVSYLWVCNCCLSPNDRYFSYIMARPSCFPWDYYDVCFCIRPTLTCLVGFFYSTSSLKQQSTGKHVAPLWHIILIPSAPVYALTP